MLAARSRTLFRVSRRTIAPQARLFSYTATTATTEKGSSDAPQPPGEEWRMPVHRSETKDPETLLRKAEEYFAMGVASCYIGALRATANKMGKSEAIDAVEVHTSVCLGVAEDASEPGITVTIQVEGVEDELMMASHKASPYNRAFDRVEFLMHRA